MTVRRDHRSQVLELRNSLKEFAKCIYDSNLFHFEDLEMGKNGWLTDPDGEKHRCKLLGSKKFIDDKQNNSRCDKCSVVFRSERALKSHRASKCRIRQDMSAEEQAKLRRKRETNESIAGRKIQ